MRVLVAASLVIAAAFLAVPVAQADPSLPEVVLPVPDAAAAAYCTCDPIPIVIVVVALLAATPCLVDHLLYDQYHSYYFNRERDDCRVENTPSYYCVGDSGSDVERSVWFVDLTIRVCAPPLPLE